MGGETRRPSKYTAMMARSIPAWAGKPESTSARREGVRVYPRVGGETPTTSI